ncbi:hypothetical protein Ahy_A07g032318 [Arachis hypogaea]|uniref:DNA-directed RNA polymerase n=1 Tax=Arachis hypogaea TaxID=3818 RepID=A0A445C6I6_ARAHY|nr:hypothetical protein Ahy_A07g032318 [Arachis hypogaea]
MHQKPQVQRGKCIKRGQILADGAATICGELALGKNILVVYMPWEGYNSEDAVLISERLVYDTEASAVFNFSSTDAAFSSAVLSFSFALDSCP